MGPGLLATVNRAADRTAQWAAVALGLSIPISTALDNVLLAVVLAGWLASGVWRMKWDTVRHNRVGLAALALFGLLAFGMLYGGGDPGDATLTLRKYMDLLWIPVLLCVFHDARMRKRAIYALAISIALVLLLSFLIMADVLPEVRSDPLMGVNATFLKTRQTHGLLMAFGAYLYLHLALQAGTPRARIVWSVLAALSVANGTLIVPGATGYLVFAALAFYLGLVWKGWRGTAAAAGVLAAAVVALMTVPGPFQKRVSLIQTEIEKWRPGVLDESSSIGTRLELYRVSLELVRDRPLFGHGTGSYAKAFAAKAQGSIARPVRNPHNEYLHWAVQLGLAGLVALLGLFWTQWRSALRLQTPPDLHLARGLVLTMTVGCLFNTWLMDHTEGLLYVWLTALLFAGLESPGGRESSMAQRAAAPA